MRAFFYDTWAFLALANSADPYHQLCTEADRRLEHEAYVGVTTDYVFDETVTGLHRLAGHRVVLDFVDLLLSQIDAHDVLLVEVNAPRRDQALKLFRKLSRDEPRLSFTDCTSFTVMRELGIEVAFTADRHFLRAGAGIRPLMSHERGRMIFHLPGKGSRI